MQYNGPDGDDKWKCGGHGDLRAPADVALPLQIVIDEHGRSEVAPSVEDPFDITRNLGECITNIGLKRLHEELARADELCSRSCSLSELLEPWVPPLNEEEDQDGEAGEGEGEGSAALPSGPTPLPKPQECE